MRSASRPEAGEHLAAYALADKRQPQQVLQALFRDFAVDAHLEFGPDTRHTKQRCRPRPAQVRQKGIQALGEKYRLPGVDRGHLDKHPLSHMAQRQVRQQPVALPQAKQLSAACGGKPQGAEAVHHALGQAGGAGGVDDGGQFRRQQVWGCPGSVSRLAGRPSVKSNVARRTQRQADGGHAGRNAGGHGGPVIELADKHQRRLGMLQHVGDGIGGEVGIKRDRDMPRHPDCQVGDDPVRAVFRDQGNVRALGQLPGAQPVRSATGLLADVGPGEGLHLAPANGLNQDKPGAGAALHVRRRPATANEQRRAWDALLCGPMIANQALASVDCIAHTKQR